jgi:hypothetical protein
VATGAPGVAAAGAVAAGAVVVVVVVVAGGALVVAGAVVVVVVVVVLWAGAGACAWAAVARPAARSKLKETVRIGRFEPLISRRALNLTAGPCARPHRGWIARKYYNPPFSLNPA